MYVGACTAVVPAPHEGAASAHRTPPPAPPPSERTPTPAPPPTPRQQTHNRAHQQQPLPPNATGPEHPSHHPRPGHPRGYNPTDDSTISPSHSRRRLPR